MSYLQQIGPGLRSRLLPSRSASAITSIYLLSTVPDVTLPAVTTVSNNSCFPGLAVPVTKSTDHKGFFMPVSLSESARSAQFLYDWYSKHLQAMNEVPLAALLDEEESYRFLWLRSFHHPVVIHVWRSGVKYFIVAKRLNGYGGYDPGTLDLYWARSVSESDWDAFLLQLEHSTYWKMKTEDKTLGTDGARWIMEGYREGHYHVVDRQSPVKGAYRDACLFLLRQSGLLAETPADEVY